MFEEHLLGGLFVYFNSFFFRIFLVEHITILPGSRTSRRTPSKLGCQPAHNVKTTLYGRRFSVLTSFQRPI